MRDVDLRWDGRCGDIDIEKKFDRIKERFFIYIKYAQDICLFLIVIVCYDVLAV